MVSRIRWSPVESVKIGIAASVILKQEKRSLPDAELDKKNLIARAQDIAGIEPHRMRSRQSILQMRPEAFDRIWLHVEHEFNKQQERLSPMELRILNLERTVTMLAERLSELDYIKSVLLTERHIAVKPTAVVQPEAPERQASFDVLIYGLLPEQCAMIETENAEAGLNFKFYDARQVVPKSVKADYVLLMASFVSHKTVVNLKQLPADPANYFVIHGGMSGLRRHIDKIRARLFQLRTQLSNEE